MSASKEMNRSVTICCILTAVLALIVGSLWFSLIFLLTAVLPWFRVVSANLLSEYQERMTEMERIHLIKVTALEAQITKLQQN